MKPLYKGLLLAALHIAIVCSLGAKLLYDRAHRPRVWIKGAIYDPELPIRGKYLALSMEVPAEGFTSGMQSGNYGGKSGSNEVFNPNRCDLVLRGDHLVAVAKEDGEYWLNTGNIRRSGDGLIGHRRDRLFSARAQLRPASSQPRRRVVDRGHHTAQGSTASYPLRYQEGRSSQTASLRLRSGAHSTSQHS